MLPCYHVSFSLGSEPELEEPKQGIRPRSHLQRQAPVIPSSRLLMAVITGQEHQDDWKNRHSLPGTPIQNGFSISKPCRNNSRPRFDDGLNRSSLTAAGSHGYNAVQGHDGGKNSNPIRLTDIQSKSELRMWQAWTASDTTARVRIISAGAGLQELALKAGNKRAAWPPSVNFACWMPKQQAIASTGPGDELCWHYHRALSQEALHGYLQ